MQCSNSQMATATDAAEIIRDMRHCASAPATASPTCWWWTTTSSSRARCSGPSSRVWARASSSARRTTRTNAKVERANSVISDTLRAYANGRKDGWDRQLPLAVFAINNASSTLGDGLTPFFIDRGAHPRLPLSAPTDGNSGGEAPAHYARRMREMERTVRELLAPAQQERNAKLDAGRVDTVFQVGYRVMLRTKELLDAADIGKLRCCGRGGTDLSRPARAPTPFFYIHDVIKW